MARSILFAEVPGFYAAVERAEDPALAGRPVIVGGDPRKRGRVQSATPDAQASGVCLDMPMLEALQQCPHARAVRTNMRRYREVSRRLLAELRGVYRRLEGFGLGAVYADVSSGPLEADELGAKMRAVVRESLSLPLRVGLGSGKFLARLAAEEAGAEGFCSIAAGTEARFLAPLDVSRLDGVGRKTSARLAELGAHTIGDVAALGRDRLQEVFGPHGLRVHGLATGADTEPVRATRHPQSVSRESTIEGELLDVAVLSDQLAGLAQQLEEELSRQRLAASKVSLKVRYADHGNATRTQTLPASTGSASEILAAGTVLLGRTQAGARPIRGLGLQLSGLAFASESDRQLDLFS